MINQFLKMGGVSSVNDFYKKFPTQQHFEHHMRNGGGIYAYAPGGSTGQDLNGINGPSMPTPNPGMQDMLWGSAPSLGQAPGQAPMSTSSRPLKNYEGVSIQDLLSAQGKAGDYKSRKALAKTLGMSNYSGTADQNAQMMQIIKQNPDVLANFTATSGTSSGGKKGGSKKQTAPVDNGFRPYAPVSDSNNNIYNFAQQYGVDRGFRPYAPVPQVDPNAKFYNDQINRIVNTPQPKTAKAAAKQKTKEANTAASTNNFQRYPGRGTTFEFDYNTYEGRPDQPTSTVTTSKKTTTSKPTNIEGTKADARYLESGMITDKNKGVMHIVKNGKVVKTMPVITGVNKDVNVNPYSVAYLDKHPEARATPTGTYLSTPNPDLYGKPGFNMNAISAFGQPAPNASNLAIHNVIGGGAKGTHNYDPAEYKRRMNLMAGPGENRTGSYGCTNLKGEDIDCLTGELFPQGDTTIVVDSRKGADKDFLKKKYGIQKMGGEPCYNCGGMYNYGGPTHQNDTYSAGVSYGTGGTYVPNPAESAYGLPEFMYGYGGYAPDGRALVNSFANGGVQDLHDAGYNLDYLAQGGPTFSDVTLYPHQAYVPAFDWMAYGGPTYSNVTQYNHQQYVPAFDWMQDGGMNSGMMMRDNQYAQGGLVKGSVHDVSEEDVQHLINQGYKIQYL